jgi:hypothetical protein
VQLMFEGRLSGGQYVGDWGLGRGVGGGVGWGVSAGIVGQLVVVFCCLCGVVSLVVVRLRLSCFGCGVQG